MFGYEIRMQKPFGNRERLVLCGYHDEQLSWLSLTVVEVKHMEEVASLTRH
jgi:hypothetical protein